MKTMTSIFAICGAVLVGLSGVVSANDFSWPRVHHDRGVLVVAGTRDVPATFSVESYTETCYDISSNINQPTLCGWDTRTFTAYGPEWPKWVPVLEDSPFAVYGADSVTVTIDEFPVQLSGCNPAVGGCTH